MFNDVDESIKQFFIGEIPVVQGEIDISFERPTREWSGRLSRPTLNCYLYDIRERTHFQDPREQHVLTERGVRRERPPRRLDLSYMLTAWAREPEDEHRILGRTLAAMYRGGEIPGQYVAGYLQDNRYPLLCRIVPADHIAKPVDLWGVMDNEIHTSLVWVLTTPLDVYEKIEGPLVRSRELRVGRTDEEWRESFIQIAGTAHKKGEPLSPIGGVRVSVAGTALAAVTGDDGRYSFPGVPPGEHVIRFETAEGVSGEKPVSVPSGDYDIEL